MRRFIVVPQNRQDYIIAGLSGVIVLSAVVLQLTNNEIPAWLLTGATGAITYYLGLLTKSRNPNGGN